MDCIEFFYKVIGVKNIRPFYKPAPYKTKPIRTWSLAFSCSFRLSVVKTKTKAITTTNHNKDNITKRTQSKTSKLPEARENADDQVMIGFSFASDWLRG